MKKSLIKNFCMTRLVSRFLLCCAQIFSIDIYISTFICFFINLDLNCDLKNFSCTSESYHKSKTNPISTDSSVHGPKREQCQDNVVKITNFTCSFTFFFAQMRLKWGSNVNKQHEKARSFAGVSGDKSAQSSIYQSDKAEWEMRWKEWKLLLGFVLFYIRPCTPRWGF